jgi:hypothetical protein
MISCPCCFGPVVRHYIMAGVCVRVSHSHVSGGQRVEEEGAGVPQSAFRTCLIDLKTSQ